MRRRKAKAFWTVNTVSGKGRQDGDLHLREVSGGDRVEGRLDSYLLQITCSRSKLLLRALSDAAVCRVGAG